MRLRHVILRVLICACFEVEFLLIKLHIVLFELLCLALAVPIWLVPIFLDGIRESQLFCVGVTCVHFLFLPTASAATTHPTHGYTPQPYLPVTDAVRYLSSWLGWPRAAFKSELQPAFPRYPPAVRSLNLTVFCRRSRAMRQHVQPRLPPHVTPRLHKRDVLFAIMSQASMRGKLGRHTNRTLASQGARVHTFGDLDAPDATLLPVSMELGAFSKGKGALGHRMLEMLSRLGDTRALGPARWWVVVDDDNFVFVERLVDLLARLPDSQPLVVGAAQAQGTLPLLSSQDRAGNYSSANRSGYNETHGYEEYKLLAGRDPNAAGIARRPIFTYNTGELLAFSAAAMPLIHKALREQRCADGWPDTAAGACALIAGVRPLSLYPWTGLVHGYRPPFPHAHFGGYLTMHHKLPDREADCMARWLAEHADAQAAAARCVADGGAPAACASSQRGDARRPLPECRCVGGPEGE